ncbi:MAG: Na(+)/H(+) antiporter subunit B [Rickettsiaceae bacterium]|nr:Na(+)/H(+) antiporter subunit B [Rickettsiaceae bacterium]
MKKHSIIFDTFAKAIIPYILLFGLYVQINGENSPGGGFQASVIIASAIIAYDMIFESMPFSLPQLIISSAFGCIIYLMVGLISIIQGSNYLNYYALAKNKYFGQFLGIFIVELGVCIAVCSVMLLIYSCLGRITSKEL